MYILSIDTSGREGSVALARGDAQSFEVLESRPLAGGTYSGELMPRISEMLQAQKVAKTDVGLYAVCSGPGSFTGLRIGLSTAKGLAEVLGKPLVAITVLEAICINARESQSSAGEVVAALDAQRGEVFAGQYDFAQEPPLLVSECLATVNDVATWLSARNPAPTVYTPDAALEKAIRDSGAAVQTIARPAADTYARIGLRKFLAGRTVLPADLDADYIRRADAKVLSAPKPR